MSLIRKSGTFLLVPCAVLSFVLTPATVSGQDKVGYEMQDTITMPPELMRVTRVSQSTGVIELDGREYVPAPEDVLNQAKRANSPGRPMSVGELEVGMSVWIVTDGIEPGLGTRPTILGLWSSQ